MNMLTATLSLCNFSSLILVRFISENENFVSFLNGVKWLTSYGGDSGSSAAGGTGRAVGLG